MTDALKLGFGPFARPAKGVLVVFCDDGLKFGSATHRALGAALNQLRGPPEAERFTGKKNSALELAVPAGLRASRLVVIGVGKIAELRPMDFLKIGWVCCGKLPDCRQRCDCVCRIARRGDEGPNKPPISRKGCVCAPMPSTATRPNARMMRGRLQDAQLDHRSRRYCSRAQSLRTARGNFRRRPAWRATLVNEPANVLYPEEFARRALALKKLRVAVEVLDIRAMKKLGMNALLGVGQGSSA